MLKWSSDLKVGHALIDAQHQELIGRLEALLAAMLRGDKGEVVRLFDFLGSYVVEHFGAEERLMQEHAYGGYRAHKAEHEKFLADYTALRRSLDGGASVVAVTVKVQGYCGDWVRAHIAGIDQELATFLGRRP
jgi:hemerythrin